MENKAVKDFVEKFALLNEENQRYIVAIQQALVFAQSSLLDDKKTNTGSAPLERKETGG